MKNLKIFLFLSLIIVNGSCLKNKDCEDIDCFTPPGPVYFKVLSDDNGENLYSNYTYMEAELNIYYIKDGTNVYLDTQLHDSNGEMIIGTQEMSLVAVKDEGETFYLELNPETTETIYLKVVSVIENCCTFHVVEELKINDSEPELEPLSGIILIKK